MQITRNSLDTAVGPEDWFTGSVYVDAVASPSAASRLARAASTSRPAPAPPGTRTRTARRSGSLEGLGLCQRRGGPIEVIRPGDRVFFDPGEEHWHGAAANRFMTHLALLQVDDEGTSAVWGDHVSDAEYAAFTQIDS